VDDEIVDVFEELGMVEEGSVCIDRYEGFIAGHEVFVLFQN
jgi:hypothetical protein